MSDQTETNENASPESAAAEPAPAGSAAPTGPVVAHFDKWYRYKHLAIYILMLVGVGIWSIYHGFYLYPRQNREWDPSHSAKPPHPGYDVPINKAMGILLPPLGIFLTVRLLRKSSGDIRLEDETLYVPQHPPIPLSAIRRIDKRRWDRKGIAELEYELGEPPVTRKFTLDNFLYEMNPINEILHRIEKFAGLEEPRESQPDTPTSA